MRRKSSCAILAAVTSVMILPRAGAGTFTWALPAAGVYSTGANWVGGSPPGSTDDVLFNVGSTAGYTVSFTKNATADSLTLPHDIVTLDLAGQSYAPGGLEIGSPQSGSLTVLSSVGGGSISSDLTIVGGSLSANSNGGIGSLTLDHGAQLVAASPSSSQLYVGLGGAGMFIIQNGATAATGQSFIGGSSANSAASTGTATVTGAGSSWVSSQGIGVGSISQGTSSSGTLNVQSGASLQASGIVVQLGAVNIQNASVTANDGFTIGAGPGSNAVVNISGVSSVVAIGGNTIGANGSTGVLNILGGKVSITGNGILNVSNTPGTSLNFGGGTLTADSINIPTGDPSLFNWTGGALTLTHAAVNSTGAPVPSTLIIGNAGLLGASAVIHPNMTLNVTGNMANLAVGDDGINGVHTQSSSLTVDGGTVAVNDFLEIGQNFFQNTPTDTGAAALIIQNGGTVSNAAANLGQGVFFGAVNVTVDGAASRWTTSGILQVGIASPAAVTIQNGGSVTAGAISISAGNGNGTVTAAGAGSSLVAGNLDVGGTSGSPEKAGVLNIMAGASVTALAQLTVWNTSGTSLNLSGGTLSVPSINFVSGDFARLNWTGGELNFSTGPLIIASTGPLGATPPTLGPGMTLSVSGANNSLTINPGGSIALAGGTLRVGSINAPPSTWTSGTLDLTNSSLAIAPGGELGQVVQLNSGMTLRVSGAGQGVTLGAGAFIIQGGALFAHSIDVTQSISNFGFISGTIQIDTGAFTVGGSVNDTFGGAITGSGSLVKTTSDTIAELGSTTYAGPTTVSAGKLILGGSLTTSSSVSIASGASLALTSGGNKVLSTPSLTLTASAILDLADNDIILPYVGTSPIAGIRASLKSAYNAGHWNGPGIQSTPANKNPTANTALGYGEATDLGITTLDGQSITGNAVIVRYAYYGDSSLDGKVDLGNDFNLFLQGYLNHGSTWELGDYNYDNQVTTADFDLFIDGYKSQGSSLGQLDSAIESSPLLTTTQKSSLLSAVPEPALVGVVAMFSLCGGRRKRVINLRP
jgi:fibronectin-binding autotransporter adhesin